MDDARQENTGKGRSHRISKACEECRRRKIKCDGSSKCKNCEQTSATCNYRSRTRCGRSARRAPQPQLQQEPQQQPLNEASQASNATQTPQQDVQNAQTAASLPRRHQLGPIDTESISVSHTPSTSCVLRLYYGASSNFSFLQQIHHSLSGVPRPSLLHDEAEDGGSDMDLYGQRSLFFGTLDTMHHSSGEISSPPVTILSEKLVECFLGDYIQTFYHLHPFPVVSELRRMTKQLYAEPHISTLSTDDTGVLMAVLAIGATMKEDIAWAETLAKKAKNIANSIGHVVNLQAVQLSLLLIRTAVRKAFAAGLHRETQLQETDTSRLMVYQERRTTVWSLVFFETLICFALGRPNSITRNDISSPYPDNQPFISALVRLSSIMTDTAGSIYSYRQSSLPDLCCKAERIHRDLRDYTLDIQERLGIRLCSTSDITEQLDIRHIFLQHLYYHTLILTFRPFLIANVNHRRSTSNVGAQSSDTQEPREIPPWLLDACRYAVGAAHDLISFIAKAIDQNLATRGLRLLSFYIEGACLLLIYDVLRDWSAKHRNLSSVRTGLQCLSKLVPRKGDSSNTLSIQRMLEALEHIHPDVPPVVGSAGYEPTTAGVLGEILSIPDVYGFHSTGQDHAVNRPGGAIDSFGTLGNFAAGWATFEDGFYTSQDAIAEPERFNPSFSNVVWEFDSFPVFGRAPL